VANTQAQATVQADAAKAAAADAFAAQWAVAGAPGFVADAAVTRLSDALAGSMAKISAAAAGQAEFAATVNGNYRALVNGLDSLVRAPRQLADQVVQLYTLPDDLSDAAARDFQAAFQWAFDLGSQLPRKPFEVRVMPPVGAGLVMYGTGKALAGATSSPGQLAIKALSDTGDRFIETLATAAYVQATAVVDLASYDEAQAVRQALHAQLLRLMEDASAAPAPPVAPASNVHDALLVLDGQALADLQERSRDLVRLTTYTPQAWQPVWYISYRLFGTAGYADEIMAMNPHIRHPLLVPPGRPLRIVRHD
jgi:hypothetical protein